MQRKLLFMFALVLVLISIPQAQPNAPTNLKATVDTTGTVAAVKLSWDSTASTGGSGRFQVYIVYKKNGGPGDPGNFIRQPFRAIRNVYIDRFVSPGKTYSYYITLIDTSRTESKHSDTASVTLPSAAAAVIITGTVKDSLTSAPVKNVRVSFIPVKGFSFTSARTDSTGHYTANVQPGTYLINFSANRYRSVFYNNALRPKNAARVTISSTGTTTYNAVLFSNGPEKFVNVSGTVTDSSGKGLQARVRALVLNHRFFQHKYTNAQTDSSGKYTLRLRAGDSVIVHAQATNNQYLPMFYNNKTELAEADRIGINGDTSGINFTLRSRPVYANSISGMVFRADSNGTTAGVPASVTAFRMGDTTSRGFRRASVLTDSTGSYIISNLLPGVYVLLAVPAQGYLPTFYRADSVQTLKWREADTIRITANSTVNKADFIVRPIPDSGFTTISGNIKNNSGQAVGGAIVYVYDVNQNVVGYTFTDAGGYYSLPFLAPGTYTVSADKVNFNSTSGTTQITVNYSGSESQTQDLTLTPALVTAVKENTTDIITTYDLSQNYPNPFNPTTRITYQVPKAGAVTLKVYNSIGQEVMTLVNEYQQAGRYTVTFDANSLSSGVYLYKLSAGAAVLSHKMVLLK